MASSLEELLSQIQKLQQGAPYDAGLATALQNAQYQMSDLDRSYTMGRSDVEKGYESGVRDLGLQRETNVKNTMGTYADRGTLHSGIHATAQGEVEQDYQRGLTGAVERKLGGFRSLDEARRQEESGIQGMLVGAQQDYTGRQAQAAQADAAMKAQREAQDAANRQAQVAAAQNAAMLRAIAAASGGGAGGGSSPAEGPRTTKVNSGMVGDAQFTAMHPEDYDFKVAVIRKMYGDPAARDWMQNNQRYGGLTTEQRAFMTPQQRQRQMVARRNV